MKKQIYGIAAVALVAALSLSGCKSREKIDLTGIHNTEAETMSPTTASQETAAADETKAETTAAADAAESSSQGTNSAQALSVRSKIATEKTGKVSIEYPILSNLPDKSLEETINALIKEKAVQILDDYEMDPENDAVSIQCSIISLDRSKAVITYSGSIMPKGAAHPTNVFYTTTVNLNKGVLMGLSDYADAYTMAGYILSDDLVLVKPEGSEDVKKELQAMDIETLTAILEQCDFSAAKLDGFPQSFSYENQGTIYLIVPVSHAAGDYAIARFSPDTK